MHIPKAAGLAAYSAKSQPHHSLQRQSLETHIRYVYCVDCSCVIILSVSCVLLWQC